MCDRSSFWLQCLLVLFSFHNFKPLYIECLVFRVTFAFCCYSMFMAHLYFERVSLSLKGRLFLGPLLNRPL